MKSYEKTYLRNAKNDLRVANLIMKEYKTSNDEGLLEAVSYHIQQCAEKYLKHILDVAGHRFDRTHNINELIENTYDAGIEHGLKIIDRKSGTISNWNTSTRYPIKHKTDLKLVIESLEELDEVVGKMEYKEPIIETVKNLINKTNLFNL